KIKCLIGENPAREEYDHCIEIALILADYLVRAGQIKTALSLGSQIKKWVKTRFPTLTPSWVGQMQHLIKELMASKAFSFALLLEVLLAKYIQQENSLK